MATAPVGDSARINVINKGSVFACWDGFEGGGDSFLPESEGQLTCAGGACEDRT